MHLKFPTTAEALEQDLVGRAMKLAQQIVLEELARMREAPVSDASVAARVALRLKKGLVG